MRWYVVSELVLLAAVVCNCLEYQHVIYIDQESGNNSQSCLTDNDPSQPCKDVGYALEFRASHTQYILSGGVHLLNGTAFPKVSEPFQSLSNLSFVGNDSVIQCTTSGVGLAFVDVTDTAFQSLTFSHCGALRESSSQDFVTSTTYKSIVSLFFNLCEIVSMRDVTVTNTLNGTGVTMYDTNGLVQITDSEFSHNQLDYKAGPSYPGGGGFYIEFTYCSIGQYQCEETKQSHNLGASYRFTRCKFTSNVAWLVKADPKIAFISHSADHIAFGRGGGLSVFFLGNATQNTVTISDCIFDSNRAQWGGGANVGFHDDSHENLLVITNSIFSNNHCNFTATNGTGGGGLRISHYVFNPYHNPNSIALLGLQFTNNSALNGGGVSFSLADHDETGSTGMFLVANSTFRGNIAKLGAALEMSKFSLVVPGELPSVHVSNCSFFSNNVQYTVLMDDQKRNELPNYETGIGAVYIDHVNVWFQIKAHFEENIGTAVAAFGKPIDFRSCIATFVSNYGNKGGAIALLGATHILIDTATEMFFYNNSAVIVGGAIYNKFIERENLKGYPHCFIRHINPFVAPNDWGAKIHFSENADHDRDRPNSIHTTSIWPCYWAGGSKVRLNENETLCWDNWRYFNNKTNETLECSKQINTDLDAVTFPGHRQEVDAFPGMQFHLPMEVTDDLGHDEGLQTVFAATSREKNIASIDDQYKYVSGEYAEVHGIENKSFTLWLDTVRDRIWHVDIKVNLLPCPPGLKATSQTSSASCECANNYQSATMCEDQGFQGFLDNGFWMGYYPGRSNLTVVGTCPPRFCKTNATQSMLKLPNSTLKLDEFLCGEQHRTGVLCGECEEGYGPAVNTETYDCILCNDTNTSIGALKYISALYIPLTLLFIAIILFNIRLTTGPANAFILYGQVLSSTFNLDGDGQIPLNLIVGKTRPYLAAYKCPYGVLNLNFIETIIKPICLGTHFNSLDVILLDYVVAFYPLLMIIFVIIFVKVKDYLVAKFRRAPINEERRPSLTWSRSFTASLSRSMSSSVVLKSGARRKRKLGDSLLPGLAAFLLLSYTKFSLTSSYLVSKTPLFDENGTDIGHERIYFYGKYDTHTPEYIRWYLIPAAVAFTIFVAIPPLLLLDFPLKAFELCIRRVPILQKYYPFDKVHILLDTFQGCYKNKMRFFAGLYFVFRLVINVAYVVSDTWLDQYGVMQIACILMIMLLAICQPYNEENKIFNYVDILIFTNLAVINSISFYLYSFAQISPGVTPSVLAFTVQYILVFLPIFYMVAYILWHYLTPYHPRITHYLNQPCMKCLERLKSKNKSKQPYEDIPGVPDLIVPAKFTMPKDEDEALFARAESNNTYRPPSVSPHPHLHSNEQTGENGTNYRDSSSGFRSGSTKSPVANYGSVGHTTVTVRSSEDASRTNSHVGGSRVQSQLSIGSARHVQFEESYKENSDVL